MFFLLSFPSLATTFQVGATRSYTRPCQVAPLVQDGDIVEIDAGTYSGDVCTWTADRLTLRGVGGFAALEANGQAAGGKAIWVIQGDENTVEWVAFSGATVPDQNGAGIRQEGTSLTIDHCYFHDNEDGILAGDNAESDIVIRNSEFANNGYGDGQSHNIYINHIRSFTFQNSISHHAYKGHTLKSRAAETWVLYSALSDGVDGQGSYQIDLPNGGFAVILGNVIQQGPAAENSALVSFAEEGATNTAQALYVVNNTFVNDRGSGTFIRNSSGNDSVVINNLLVGGGTALDGPGQLQTCLETNDAGFVDGAAGDYRLLETSVAIDAGSDPGSVNGFSLWPVESMFALDDVQPRPVVGALDLGAFEWGVADPGDSASDSANDSDLVHDSEQAVNDGVHKEVGCGCSVSSPPIWLGFLPLGALLRRRRSGDGL